MARIRRELDEQGVVYAPHHHNEYIMRMGYLMNEFGLPLEQAIGWADGRFPEYDGDVAAIFRSCYADTEAHGRREAELFRAKREKKGKDGPNWPRPRRLSSFSPRRRSSGRT